MAYIIDRVFGEAVCHPLPPSIVSTEEKNLQQLFSVKHRTFISFFRYRHYILFGIYMIHETSSSYGSYTLQGLIPWSRELARIE